MHADRMDRRRQGRRLLTRRGRRRDDSPLPVGVLTMSKTDSTHDTAKAPAEPKRPMMPFVRELVRPYYGWLAIVFAAMVVETLMSLAAPWPLKIVLDDALGTHKLPQWLEWAHDYGFGRHTIGVALFAGAATIVIAVFGAIASYIDNYYTERDRKSTRLNSS